MLDGRTGRCAERRDRNGVRVLWQGEPSTGSGPATWRCACMYVRMAAPQQRHRAGQMILLLLYKVLKLLSPPPCGMNSAGIAIASPSAAEQQSEQTALLQ